MLESHGNYGRGFVNANATTFGNANVTTFGSTGASAYSRGGGDGSMPMNPAHKARSMPSRFSSNIRRERIRPRCPLLAKADIASYTHMSAFGIKADITFSHQQF